MIEIIWYLFNILTKTSKKLKKKNYVKNNIFFVFR